MDGDAIFPEPSETVRSPEFLPLDPADLETLYRQTKDLPTPPPISNATEPDAPRLRLDDQFVLDAIHRRTGAEEPEPLRSPGSASPPWEPARTPYPASLSEGGANPFMTLADYLENQPLPFAGGGVVLLGGGEAYDPLTDSNLLNLTE